MSHEIFSKFRVENGTIIYTYAPSNVYPRAYYEGKMNANEQGIKSLIREVIWGCVHASASTGNFCTYCNGIKRDFASLNTASKWEEDRYYGTKRYDDFLDLFAEKIGLPRFRKVYKLDGDTTEDAQALADFEKETENIYAQEEAKFAQGGKVRIRGAIISSLFKGYDVLANEEAVYLAKRENYKAPVLDNADGSAVKLDDTIIKGKNAFGLLNDGSSIKEFSKEEVAHIQRLLADKGIVSEAFNALIEKEFPHDEKDYASFKDVLEGKFSASQSKTETKINYIKAFEWRWTTDKPAKWHTSFIVDMIQNGKRYVLIKASVVYCHGVTGDKCDKALKEFQKEYEKDFKEKGTYQEKRLIEGTKDIVIPAMQEIDGELWDIERAAFNALEPIAVTKEVTCAYCENARASAKAKPTEQFTEPTKETPRKAEKTPFTAYSDMELSWNIKFARLKGDENTLNGLIAEQQKRMDASKHQRLA